MNNSRGPIRTGYLIALLVLSAGLARANEASITEEHLRCLECHARPGIVKFFQNNDSLLAYVNPDTFLSSVHKSLSCTDCHFDFLSGKHPNRVFKSKEQYQVKSSHVCRKCHSEEQIKRRNVHRGLLQAEGSGKAAMCTNCHGSHAVMRVSGKSSFTTEEQYCMKCHDRSAVMHFGNGETAALKVDPSLLRISVHAKLSCSDCHYSYSSTDHPRRQFRTRRDFTLASSDSCRRCHFDKYTKTMESIHYTVLREGKLNAPVCTDCHGAHEVYHVGKERTTSAKRCQRCHAQEYDIYAKSVHGNALFNEHNQDVPVCIDCHTAHTIQNPFSTDYRERIPEMCSNCHAKKEVVGKYGLSINVVKSYLSDFHGTKLGIQKMQKGDAVKPYKPIAVCTDCHGTHNIMGTSGTEATIVKTNLIKRCQKCHTDANERFPDAWLSHYDPSLKQAPLVYLAGMVYQIFIPILVIGFILQVLLHIWRYAMNR